MDEADQNRFRELAIGKIYHENSSEEASQLEELLKIPANERSYAQLLKIHNSLDKIKSLEKVSGKRTWEKVDNYFRGKRRKLYISFVRYAAIILMAFVSGYVIQRVSSPFSETMQMAEIRVPLGQMSEVTLYDGTHIWLNSGTTLRYAYDFGKNDRNVVLDGEAFFKVSHGQIPFRVKLKSSEIEVMGTSFDVVSYKDDPSSEVTLVEGSVKLYTASGKEIARLKPSEQITIPDNLQRITLEKQVNTDFFISWTEGRIVFEEERLSDVVEKLQRWYNVVIRLEGQNTGDMRFSGTILKNKQFDQIAKAIRLLLPVNVTYQTNPENKDVIIISKRNMPMKN